jgi:hypothetical protein
MVTRAQAFPSKYFCGDDVAKPLAREIQHCGIEPLKNKEGITSDKLIVYFVGEKKALVCNRTNWDSIVEITNESDTDLWIGHRICLFASLERVAGKMVNCVRVRAASAPPSPKKGAPTPKAPTPKAPTPPTDDEDALGEEPSIPDAELERIMRESAERTAADDDL